MFGVLAAVAMEITIFWDMTPYCLVGCYQSLLEKHCPHLENRQHIPLSELGRHHDSVTIYQTHDVTCNNAVILLFYLCFVCVGNKREGKTHVHTLSLYLLSFLQTKFYFKMANIYIYIFSHFINKLTVNSIAQSVCRKMLG
jgi:hypothetical protein